MLKEKLSNGDNGKFWVNKISKNIEHDEEVNKQLKSLGWTVVRFWGKDIKKHTSECVRTIEEMIFDIKVSCNEYDS